jgi:carbon storage regulator
MAQAALLRVDHSFGRGESGVLVLTRKSNQSIMIGDDIEISVLAVMGEKVRIGIDAPRSVPVFRREVYVEIQDDRDGDGDDTEEADPALQAIVTDTG